MKSDTMKRKMNLGKNAGNASVTKDLANEFQNSKFLEGEASLAMTQADEIDDLLVDIPSTSSLPVKKPDLAGLNLQLNQYMPNEEKIDYADKYQKIRIAKFSPIQSTKTVSSTTVDELRCDVCKETIHKSAHMILCEVCLVPVHCECYRKDLLSMDIDKVSQKKGSTAKILGKYKNAGTIVVRGWKCQR